MMTQLSLRDDASGPVSIKARSHGKQATIAFLLSLIFPGLGQVYNRQPRKALAMALTFPLLAVLLGQSRALLFFWGMVVSLSILIVWRIFIVVDAARVAWTSKNPEAAFRKQQLAVTVIVGIVLIASLFPTSAQFLRWYPYFKAFSIPSASMCPAICVGDRIVADMSAYKHRTPQRGDLIMLAHRPFENLIIKRVIGVEGDLIETNEHGQILVNGTVLKAPELCGHPTLEPNQSTEMPAFPPTKVAPRTFFVVGDNLSNSFDSRIPEFGLVTANEIRGRPESIYFSHQFSRIGCKLR
jgi:signal peptidase I